jgi:hypothetical protein
VYYYFLIKKKKSLVSSACGLKLPVHAALSCKRTLPNALRVRGEDNRSVPCLIPLLPPFFFLNIFVFQGCMLRDFFGGSGALFSGVLFFRGCSFFVAI